MAGASARLAPRRWPGGGILGIIVAGTVLGLAYNGVGQRSGWGIPWRGSDRISGLPEMGPAVAGDG